MLALVSTAEHASAQESPVPLTKSEVVRLLAGATYGEAEQVAIIDRACLSFEPTDQDMEGFRRLGASDAFVDAVRACLDSRMPLTVEWSRSDVTARAGESIAVALTAHRDGRPAGGASLILDGSGDLPGGPDRDLTVVTDPEGRAVARFQVGTATGVRSIRLASPTRQLEGRLELILRIRAGRPGDVRVDPGELVLLEGRLDREEIEVVVVDRYGNPTAGAGVELRVPGRIEGGVMSRAVSDDGGRASLELRTASLGGAGLVEFWSRDRMLGRREITWIPADQVSAGFVEGMQQSAPPGALLASPLVFELLGPDGRPLARQPVRFSASGGSVVPSSARSDEAGRVAVRVRLADDAPSTRLVAVAGDVRAEAVLGAEGSGGARRDADRLLREGEEALAAATYGAAADRFRAVLEDRPGHAGALLGLGTSLSRLGETGAAIDVLEDAARRKPSDPAVWTTLASAWRSVGRTEEARLALLRGRRRVDPVHRDSIAVGLAHVLGRPPAPQVSVWGGGTLDVPGSGGVRNLEVSMRPTPAVRAWGRYDGSLGLDLPILTRGPDVLDAYYVGGEVDWGREINLSTILEIGRREQIPDVYQLLYRIDQGIRITTAGVPVRAHVGGMLGRWFDRDDWVAYTRWIIPVSLTVDVEPAFYLGETLGTDLARARRQPSTDARAHLSLDIRPEAGWRVRPLVGFGRVESDVDELSGSLWEAMLRVEARVAGTGRIQILARHQSAPGSEGFTVLAAGFVVGVR